MTKKLYATCIMLVSFIWGAWAQSPTIKWEKGVITAEPYITPTTDGSLGDLIDVNETLLCMLPTADGGYMGLLRTQVGKTISKLVKFSATGDTLFTRELGLISNIGGYAVWDMIAGSDGGFITVGSTVVAGVVVGVPYDELLSLRKYDDNGMLMWEETYTGGYFIDNTTKRLTAASLTAATDGGYVIAAGSNNLAGNDKTENTKGEIDYWVIKTNNTGLIDWDKTIGGSGTDNPMDVVTTKDGGYVVIGYSNSPASGDKSQGQKGASYDNDFWVVKIDASGNKVWDKTLGTDQNEYARLLIATPDGGVILSGDSNGGINGDKTEANYTTDEWDSQTQDTWIVKLDNDGNIKWQKSLGGRKTDVAQSAYVQADGSLVINISSNSPVSASKKIPAFGVVLYDEPSETYYSVEESDYWVVKLSPDGAVVWETVLGGMRTDVCGPILPAQDGGILVTGRSSSMLDGNRTAVNKTYNEAIGAGGGDIWMVVLDETILPVSLLSFTGNVASNGKALLQWKTATEENFGHFELEKSTNLQYYSEVVRVSAKGNSSTYGYTDNIGNGITYYRLKMVDKDGTVQYSNIVAITSGGDAILAIAPNPVPSGGVLTMRVSPAPKNAFWQIIGVDGKLYGTQAISTGATQVKIDTRILAKGTYNLVYAQGNDRKVIRFITN